MATFPCSCTSSYPLLASSTPNIHKWSIAEDLSSIVNPSKHNYPSKFQSFTDEFSTEHEKEMKEVRSMLREAGENPPEVLIMVDTLQRLAIDHHFKEEIEDILRRQYENFGRRSYDEQDLNEVSTCFRLLRQEGYNVSTEVFNNFRDKRGRFKSELSTDIGGVMALYEASQLCFEGEEILDYAADFCVQLFNGWMKHLDHHQARVIANTLQHPCHKNPARFMTKNFLTDCKGQNGLVSVLHEIAKSDFNMVRTTHQKEILQVSKWWKDTGLSKELKFVRDQPLKWYTWSMVTLTDPSLSEQRIELTKPISLVYVIDDIFDVYGTLEELTLFTEAVNRWEVDATTQLPDYMKICFKALEAITNEIAYKVHKEHGYNPIYSLRRAWASLCNAFLVEAKWFASGQLPKAEEYLKNGIISSGVPVVLVHIFFLLGHGINKESVDYVNDNPDIITSTATILRLWDDLGSAKDENQDGHDGSYVECYMKEHKGSSVESARKQVSRMISEAWKRLNQECLTPSNLFSESFKKACLNSARMVSLMYSYDDNQSLPIIEEYMKSILYGCTVSL